MKSLSESLLTETYQNGKYKVNMLVAPRMSSKIITVESNGKNIDVNAKCSMKYEITLEGFGLGELVIDIEFERVRGKSQFKEFAVSDETLLNILWYSIGWYDLSMMIYEKFLHSTTFTENFINTMTENGLSEEDARAEWNKIANDFKLTFDKQAQIQK